MNKVLICFQLPISKETFAFHSCCIKTCKQAVTLENLKIPTGFQVDFISLDANNLHRDTGGRTVRDTTTRQWKDHAKYKCSRESFNIDTAKLWNRADTAIKSAKSLSRAKTLIL